MSSGIDVGHTASITVKVTDKMVHQFADMSGDRNPIHLDDAYAEKSRYKRRIAHGMIVGALISRALVDGIGGGGIYLGQSLKFVNPVFIDDTVTITIKVTGIRKKKVLRRLKPMLLKKMGISS